jgi:flagellar M-ring protein FliF
MLDPVLGAGKVIVRANVQISLQETLMTKEEFDPDNKVVRSQRQSSDENGAKGGNPGVQANLPGGDATKANDGGAKRSSEMTTYEIGRTTSRIMEPRGQIQKLSVAVMVDGKYDNEKYLARSAAEMEIIKGIVKRAVGFDTDRGDEIEIANVPFKIQPASPLNPLAAPTLKDMAQTPMGMAAGGGALLVLGTLAFFMLRRKKPATSAAEPASAAALPTEPPASAAAIQEEVAAAAQKIIVSEDPRKEQLSQIAHDYHDASVRIIRTWLQEDAAKARAAAAGGGIIANP